MSSNDDAPETKPLDFVREQVKAELDSKKHAGVVTRFPPEPNGYLHLGHAKSICLNFGIAKEFGGRCHLRFDDTNPLKEDEEFTTAIQEDVKWLGFDWGEHLHFTSDYFEQLHAWALALIDAGKAYVDLQPYETIKAQRGTLTEPGTASPHRDTSPEENRALFEKMTAGELDEGAAVLRAKIDMASPNLNLRDPAMYRIRKATHHRTGDAWCIYPMYDWAHGQSDAIEAITHSICTLEFENHRPLYDWYLDQLTPEARPRQIEFAKLKLTYVLMSKRILGEMVKDGIVDGWDDPRMPTLRGVRRRGFPPEAIRALCEKVGVAKNDAWTDLALLEHEVRSYLEDRAPRVMCVLDPLKVVIENYPEGERESFTLEQHPKVDLGTREVPFTRELYIEREDFMEDPPKKFFRLGPGREVRLRGAGYFIKCESVVKNDAGEIVELRCTYDPATKGGDAPDGRKVKGTIHWVSAEDAVDLEVRVYDRLFTVEHPGTGGADYKTQLNPEALVVKPDAKGEPALRNLQPGERVQLERTGYFVADEKDSVPGQPVLNRILALRDSWAKAAKKG